MTTSALTVDMTSVTYNGAKVLAETSVEGLKKIEGVTAVGTAINGIAA